MTVALLFALLVGRRLNLPPRLALLIGVGTAVCGNSAIVATAPVIKADEREVGFAVGTITFTGTLALFLYPVIGHLLQMTDVAFGVWSGVAVNDTSQVVATSAAYSLVARDVATVVKLVRNALMAPLIMLIAWWWSRNAGEGAASGQSWLKALPPFVLMFLGLALLRSVGLIPAGLLRPHRRGREGVHPGRDGGGGAPHEDPGHARGGRHALLPRGGHRGPPGHAQPAGHHDARDGIGDPPLSGPGFGTACGWRGP